MTGGTFPNRPLGVKDVFAGAAILIALVALGLWWLFEPFGRDQGIHATIGAAWRAGLTVYADVYNVKPPLTTPVHALSQILFGQTMMAIRLLDFAMLAATFWGFYRLMVLWGFSRLASLAPPLVFAVIYADLNYWNRAQTDGWAAFACLWAVLCLTKGWQSGRRSWVFAAGLLMGVGFLLKFTVGTIGAVIFAPLLARGGGVPFRLGDLLALVAGGLVSLVIVLGYVWGTGALDDMLEIQRFVAGYVASWRGGPGFMIEQVWASLSLTPVVPVALGIGAIALLASLGTAQPRLRAWLILLWVASGFASYWVQGKGFPYHLLPLYLPAAALAAIMIDALRVRLSSPQAARALAVAVLVGIFLSPAPLQKSASVAAQLAQGQPVALDEPDYELFDYSVAGTAAGAQALNALMQPGETLFLWGFATEMYFRTGTVPLHRFAYTYPFMAAHHDGRYTPDLLTRLKANPPDWVAIERGDQVPHVSGRLEDSERLLLLYPEIAGFFAAGYELAERTHRFDFMRRLGE